MQAEGRETTTAGDENLQRRMMMMMFIKCERLEQNKQSVNKFMEPAHKGAGRGREATTK